MPGSRVGQVLFVLLAIVIILSLLLGAAQGF
jgi:hypothetical protein